ncbi:MAG: adenosylmethionine--8-amino-7-oxononanoate transaminase [Candidatus Cyclobacteriaceae bacterium M2_1C_046]
MQKRSAEDKKIDQDHIWHPFTSLRAIESLNVVKGQGIYLHTNDGRKIMDVISSWWVNLHGHSNPFISKAVADQAHELEHVIFAGFTHPPAIELTKKLINVLPSKMKKLFFSDDGSTAIEVGLKMAIQYWYNKGFENKRKVIAWEGAYHGDTFGAMSVGDRNAFTTPFQPYLFDVIALPFPDKNNEEDILKTFEQQVASGEVAVFIFEPLVQGAAGMRMYSAELLDKLISIAHQYDVLCLADEVFTGFYRTGKMFATDHLTQKPDIIAISKGLTGGYLPMSITACSEELVKAFDTDEKLKTFYHGHSYTANPLACAAANASFDLLITSECLEQIRMINKNHLAFHEKIKLHHSIKDSRVLGTILAIELKSESKTSYFNTLRDKIYDHFLSKDILMRPIGNVIYMVPPYVITEEELRLCYEEIENFINSIL